MFIFTYNLTIFHLLIHYRFHLTLFVFPIDTSHKGPTQVQERDGLKLPQDPITRSKARQMRSKLNGTIQEFVSKALDAYTKERENQDSLSCFQENQENQDFKSWKSWSKKPNLAAKAHWISDTSINDSISERDGS
ncbi:hypothetical protein Gotur_032167 [Gossypium turneri]